MRALARSSGGLRQQRPLMTPEEGDVFVMLAGEFGLRRAQMKDHIERAVFQGQQKIDLRPADQKH